MQWDLGLQGVAVLLVMSLGFGLLAQALIRKVTTSRVWVFATAGYFVVGLVISEVWFGWATEEELQPNIDGLSFDEVLLGVIPGVAILIAIRYWLRRSRDASKKVTTVGSSR
ncbi:MAG TPA: hypothetical protein VJR05_12390 [Acidimicrobiia bacterium]|nr:hypothetical protein [Acidimicrobiia bacterium]